MWPFKPKTIATAMSGVIACDGKHHTWSTWKVVEQPYALRNSKTGGWVNGIQLVQQRTCVICNYIEQREMGK
jgi:hypothetical protein